jgi:hypothetical protein
MFVMRTVASGTAAPLGSITVPCKVPVGVWANTPDVKPANNASTAANEILTLMNNLPWQRHSLGIVVVAG